MRDDQKSGRFRQLACAIASGPRVSGRQSLFLLGLAANLLGVICSQSHAGKQVARLAGFGSNFCRSGDTGYPPSSWSDSYGIPILHLINSSGRITREGELQKYFRSFEFLRGPREGFLPPPSSHHAGEVHPTHRKP